jgi:Ca-activated chloride channel family protein
VDKPRWVEPPTGRAKQTRGGTSFEDAPLLTPGSYRDDIVQGETLTYQVDVDWGQQLTARVGLPALTGQRVAAATGSPLVSLSVFSPARTPAFASSVDGHLSQAILTRYGHELGTVSGPVAFLNTSESEPALHGSDLAGRYTVTVFLGKKPAGRSVPVPFTMRLGVSGSPHGEPQFASAPVSPDSSPTPDPRSSSDASGPADGGGFPTGLLLGALGAVALAAAAVLTVRSVHARA